jgi:hypothetical protein
MPYELVPQQDRPLRPAVPKVRVPTTPVPKPPKPPEIEGYVQRWRG